MLNRILDRTRIVVHNHETIEGLRLMFDDKLQGSRDRVLSKFYLRFWLRLNPNTISTIGFIFGIFCIIFILQKLFLFALIFWLLNRFFDGLDGLVARKTGKQTELGAYLDILYSFFIYSFFIFALILVNIANEEIVIAGSLLLCLYYVNSVSWAFLSLLIEKRRKNSESLFAKENRFPPALVEKGETIIFYMFFLLFSEFNVSKFATATTNQIADFVEHNTTIIIGPRYFCS